MTREEATLLIYQLINSGILDEELENKLTDVANHICADDFEKCEGTEHCRECKFIKK